MDSTDEKIKSLQDEVTRLRQSIARVEANYDRLQVELTAVFKQMLTDNQRANDIRDRETQATNQIAINVAQLAGDISRLDDKVNALTYVNHAPAPMMRSANKGRGSDLDIKIVNLMADHFDNSHLDELLFQIGMPLEISGSTLTIRANNILKQARMMGRFTRLIQQLAHDRPFVDWPFGTGWLENNDKK